MTNRQHVTAVSLRPSSALTTSRSTTRPFEHLAAPLLALFLTVGAFKTQLVGLLPEWLDPTILLAALLACGAALGRLSQPTPPAVSHRLSAAKRPALLPRSPNPESRISPLSRLILPFAALIIVMILSALGPDTISYGVEKLARFAVLTGLATFAPLLVIRTEQHLRRLLIALLLIGLLMTAFGTATPEGLRAFGATHIATGRIIGLALIAALYLTARSLRSRRSTPGIPSGVRCSDGGFRDSPGFRASDARRTLLLVACVLLAALLSAGLIHSGSRGSMIALAIGLITIALVSFALKTGRRWVSAGLGLILGLVTTVLFLVPSAAETMNRRMIDTFVRRPSVGSVQGRIQRAEDALALISAHPLTGIGIGGFDLARGIETQGRGDYPHNILLETASELGLPGLIALLLILVFALAAAVRAMRRSRSSSRFATATTVLLIMAYLTANALFSGDLNDNRMLFAATGLCFAVERMEYDD